MSSNCYTLPNISSLKRCAAALLAATLIASPSAWAGDPAGDEAKGAKAPQPQQPNPQQQAMQIQQKLVQIQKATVEANPELAEQQQELQALIQEKMKANGHTPEKDMSRLKKIREQAQAEDMDKKERQSLAQEFQQTRQKLGNARREAMQDEEVQEKTEALQQDMIAAMKEQNPETEKLLKQMEALQAAHQQQRQRPGQ